tara:strand:+ start:36 stop:491 length:456 start_codon:yes stop_codon:yes gene_type:complete
MANVQIGSHPSFGEQIVESIDTTGKQLEKNDSGKIFMCDQNGTADVDINLPELSTSIAGWNAKFVLRTAAANDFHIMAYGNVAAGGTSGDADTIVYTELTDSNTTAASADVIQFTGGAASAGAFCDILTDGTSWYAYIRDVADAGVVSVDS